MILVTDQDIVNTYSHYDRLSCQKYLEYLKLVKENPSFGYKRCSKILGIPMGRCRWRHTKRSKRGKPLPLKTVDKLKEAGFLPFKSNHRYAESIFRIYGTLLGDVGIDCRLNTMSFISSVKENVDLWVEDLVKIFPFIKEKINLREGGEYGHSYCMRTYDRAVIRFFVALGVPVGDKMIVHYSIPAYFKNLNKINVKSFLDGLFSSEIAIPRAVISRKTNFFKNFSFSLGKTIALEKDHLIFLKDIQRLTENLGVKFTPNLRKDANHKRKRKDGKESNGCRIFFRSGIPNVLEFQKLFPLKYSAEKKLKFDEEIKKALSN